VLLVQQMDSLTPSSASSLIPCIIPQPLHHPSSPASSLSLCINPHPLHHPSASASSPASSLIPCIIPHPLHHPSSPASSLSLCIIPCIIPHPLHHPSSPSVSLILCVLPHLLCIAGHVLPRTPCIMELFHQNLSFLSLLGYLLRIFWQQMNEAPMEPSLYGQVWGLLSLISGKLGLRLLGCLSCAVPATQ
jgi:hypothetical protein